MDPAAIALFTALLPAVAAALVFLAVRWTQRGRAEALAAGAALAAGTVAGYCGAVGLPRFPPAESWQWVLPISVAGGVLAAAEAAFPGAPAAVRWSLRAALVAFAVWASLLDHSPLPVAGLAAAAIVFAWTLARTAAGSTAAAYLPALLVAAVGASVAIGVSNWMDGGRIAGGFAAATGGCLVASLRFPAASRDAVAVAAPVFVTLLVSGCVVAALPVSAAVLLAASPAAAWLADAAIGARETRVPRALLRAAAAAVPAGAAIAIAVVNSPKLEY